MLYNSWDYRVLGRCPSCGIILNMPFQKLYLFPSSDHGVGEPTLLSLLERVNLSHWID
jgi:hypothetical protein